MKRSKAAATFGPRYRDQQVAGATRRYRRRMMAGIRSGGFKIKALSIVKNGDLHSPAYSIDALLECTRKTPRSLRKQP